MTPRSPSNRRAFLCGLVRWPVLAGLGALGAYLATRRGDPARAADPCINRGLCRTCRALGTCARPQAHLARRAGAQRPGEPAFWPQPTSRCAARSIP